MILTLIGTRGTGKSTVAPLLAERLGWDWIDADVELERLAGKTIREIFATEGEPVFRTLERQNLVELLQRDRLVLAAGGGAILNPDTRRDFRAAGPVIWLQATPETVAARVAADPITAVRRPNLTAAGGIEEIRAVLQQREALYRETASVCVVTDNRTASDIADDILARLPALGSGGR
jgi:shikimate kinase